MTSESKLTDNLPRVIRVDGVIFQGQKRKGSLNMLLWHTDKLISCRCIFGRTAKLCGIEWCSLCGLFLIQNFFKSGQSYEIRMLDNRKMGDIPEISGKLVKVRTVCFICMDSVGME